MSGFTIRSPSPNQNRSPSANRSARTPESSSSVRKSVDLSHYSHKFSSPSDSSHKSFNSKHFSSQKENERDPTSLSKPATKGRSPLQTSSSSSHKGFMAPTISASSKGRSPVLPSPRARAVLSERNQNPTQIEEVFSITDSKTSPVPKIIKLESEPAISLPPYDPKTNYLSPRPQYLHYKPIPRIELYKKGELDLFDARNLEDSFSSESSESSVKTEEEESSPPPSELIETEEKEIDAVSSDIESPETELQVPITNATKRIKLKIAPIALIILLIGCIFLPLSDSPVLIHNSYSKSPSLHFSTFETRLMEFSSRLIHWSTQSAQYLSNLFATETPFPIEIGTFPLANLSSQALGEIGNLDSNLAWPIFNGESVSNEMEAECEEEEKNVTVSFETIVENEDVKEMEDRFEIATNIEEKDDDNKEKVEETEKYSRSESDTEKNPQEFTSEAENEMDNGFGSEHVKIEHPEVSTIETIEVVDNGFVSEPVKTENPKESTAVETINEVDNGFESEPFKAENPEESTSAETISGLDNGFGSQPVKAETESSNLISNPAIGIIAAFAITSLASLLLLSAYKNKSRDLVNRNSVSHPTSEKPTKRPVKEKSGILNSGGSSSESHATQMDMETEFSTSFDGTKFSTGEMDRRRDSLERFSRRESDVSTGSFGSFTTYEKISSKKVNGEEVTTPVTVRRSSRIRSRVSLN